MTTVTACLLFPVFQCCTTMMTQNTNAGNEMLLLLLCIACGSTSTVGLK